MKKPNLLIMKVFEFTKGDMYYAISAKSFQEAELFFKEVTA